MEIDSLHPQYEEFAPVWGSCRDASTGQRAIHKGGKLYLPMLGGQTDEDYKAYKMRALYFNATGRTVDGMAGLVFRKKPMIDLPTALQEFEQNIDLTGQTLSGLAHKCVEEVIRVGRGGLLVDYPDGTDDQITVSQARSMGLRPYVSMYKAESIRNWKTGRVNNANVLTWLTLSERYEEDGEYYDQIRELALEGNYIQRVWRQNENGEWFVYSEYTPIMNGQPLTKIPFYFLAVKEGSEYVSAPPIESLAYVNIAHYRNSADYENGAHVAGLPTPWINGVTDPENFPELHLGSNTFLKLPPDSEAGFLQCGSEGFATIEQAMKSKEDQMAALGARMLAPEKAAAETAEAHEIKRGGENSVLAALAGSIDATITKALQFMAEWSGANPDEVSIELNKDYLPAPMTAQMLTAWVATWQSGGISDQTFFGGLQSGELIPETLTFDEEQGMKAESAPALGTLEG